MTSPNSSDASGESVTDQPVKIEGIGRPNLQITTDYMGGGATRKFVLHMEIPNLSLGEATDLSALLQSTDKSKRALAKAMLKALLKKKNVNYKGGHRLVEGIPDDPADDAAGEP